MTPSELLVIGIIAGLILYALLAGLRNRTLGRRELLTALSPAILIEFAINARRGHDLTGVAVTFPGEPLGFPHVCPCIAAIVIGILAVLHVRGE